MFIRVYYNAIYFDIEPQASPPNFAMSVHWGVAYDPMYSKNVTAEWGGY